jgi:transcriptional regulator NrdR family protein
VKCPRCNSKLRVNDSRQLSPDKRWREYACLNCGKFYYSTESLDKTVIIKNQNGKVLNRLRRVYNEKSL